jgi:hypothetical protein
MFAGKIVKRDAAIGKDPLDTKRPLLARSAGHYLGPERNTHFRSRPHVCSGSFWFVKNTHIIDRDPADACVLPYVVTA